MRGESSRLDLSIQPVERPEGWLIEDLAIYNPLVLLLWPLVRVMLEPRDEFEPGAERDC